MQRNNTILFGVSILLSSLTLAGIKLGLYELFPWYDIVMHTLGGIFVSLLTIVTMERYGIKKMVIVPILATLLVGTAWEILELMTIYSSGAYPFMDTLSDMVYDIAGAVIAIVVTSNILKKKKEM